MTLTNPTRLCGLSWHMMNRNAAVSDILLSLVLCVATGVVVLRLERRLGLRFQFTVADLLSLMAATAAVLGLVCLEALGESVSPESLLTNPSISMV